MFSASTRRQVREAIPIGEAAALSARAIWRKIDVWAESSIDTLLGQMATAGEISTARHQIQGDNTISVYWRERP